MTQTTTNPLQLLTAPFPAATIAWRVGQTTKDKKRGQALPYIDARAVQKRLDEAVGPGNWKTQYKPSPIEKSIICEIAIRVEGEWVGKEDGAQLDTFSDDAAEGASSSAREVAIKGAYSDAFKRAAVMWGVGRYLYDYEAQWVELDDYRRLKTIPRLPDWALPENEQGGKGTPAGRVAATPVEETAQEAVPATKAKVAEAVPEAPVEPPKAVEPAKAAEPAPDTAKPAESAPAKAEAAAAPSGMSDEQRKVVDGLVEKIRKGVPLTMIENYLNGAKGQALPNTAQQYLRECIDKKRAGQDV